jgi:hypothetical protein
VKFNRQHISSLYARGFAPPHRSPPVVAVGKVRLMLKSKAVGKVARPIVGKVEAVDRG